VSVQAVPPGGRDPAPPIQLTADQEAALARIRDEWAGIGLGVGATDRHAAEAGVRLAYQAAGLAPPERVVWLDSPLRGVLAAAMVSGLEVGSGSRGLAIEVCGELAAQGWLAGRHDGRPLRSWIGPPSWARLRAEVEEQVGRYAWMLLWARIGRALSLQLLDYRTGIAPLHRTLGDMLTPTLELWRFQGAVEQSVTGGLDAIWAAIAAGVRQLFPAAHGPEQLAGLERVTTAAGWWWPFERTVVICERPVTVQLDDAGRFHGVDGPALAWRDGFAIHAWHGMLVPAHLIAQLADVRVADIQAEPNTELRRIMLEHYGSDRYLREMGATRLHQDAAGTLWRAAVPGDEPLVMVEVVNATPEPDGTSRVYWLRVPPWIRTAREGVAWTFGLSEEQYRPLRES
jgi:hypothetical protein